MGMDGKPATTPLAREKMIVSAAMDLAEEQIRSGTASAQVITHFLKLGSSREMLEQERIAKENTLLQAKADALAAQARIEELYGEAINAMRAYSGQAQTEVGDEYDD